LPDGTADGSPAETAARSLIEDIHAELASRRDLFPTDLFETGKRIAAGRGMSVDHEDKPYATAIDRDADRNWREALFAIPAIGMVSKPTRTKWGWDLALWVDTIPGRELSDDQLRAEIFPDLRRSYFKVWAHPLARGVSIEVDADQLRALVDDGAQP
jgi:hypothetical protein